MAKKKKNPIGISGRRLKEKMRLSVRAFDWAMAAYVVVVVASTLVGRCGDYDLGSANLHGFALWFLLIPAYLLLEVLSFVNYIGNFNWDCTGFEAELLGICNLVMAIGTWCYVRMRAGRWSVQTVRNIRMFVLILVFWGVFQLGCSAVLWMWRHGGFSSFNRHLTVKKEAVAHPAAKAAAPEK